MNNKVRLGICLLTLGSCAAASPAAETLEVMPLIRQLQDAGANRVGRETQRGVKRGLRVEDSGYNSSDYSDSNYYYGDEYEYSYEEMKNRSSSDEEWDSEETSDSEDSSENYYAPELPTSDSSKWETENQGNEFYDFEETKPASTSNWQKECDPEFLAEEEEECLPTYKGAEETAEPNWSGTHSDYPAPAPVANSSNGGGGVGAIITDTGDQLGQAAIVGVVGALVAWLQGDGNSDHDDDKYNWEDDDYENSWDEGYDNAYSNDVGEGDAYSWENTSEEEADNSSNYGEEQPTESWNSYGEDTESQPEYWDGQEEQGWNSSGPETNPLFSSEAIRLLQSRSAISINNVNNNIISLEQTLDAQESSNIDNSYSRLKPSTENYLNRESDWLDLDGDDFNDIPFPPASNIKATKIAAAPLPKAIALQKANQALSPKLPTAPVAAPNNVSQKPLSTNDKESTDWAEISSGAIDSSDSLNSSNSITPTRLRQGSSAPSQSVPEASPGWVLVIGGGLFVGQQSLKNRRNQK